METMLQWIHNYTQHNDSTRVRPQIM